MLHRPAASDEKLIREAIEAAADALPVMLEQGAQKAMNRLHTQLTVGWRVTFEYER